MTREFNLNNILSFIDEWWLGKLSPSYRTQAVPVESHDGKICILVGSNFSDQIASRSEVLVIFYAPWCKHS